MTEKQTVEIVTTICMSYPSFEKLGADAVKGMVKIWAMLFADDDYSLVQLAVAKHISTSKWPPSVSEIREQMMQIEHPELIPPDRAWALVRSAISAFGEFGTGLDMNMLPPLITSTINAIGWKKLWQLRDDGMSVRGSKANADRMTFLAQYTPAYEREREKLMLPRGIAGKIIDCEAVLEPAKRMIADKQLQWRRTIAAISGLEELEQGDTQNELLLQQGMEEI